MSKLWAVCTTCNKIYYNKKSLGINECGPCVGRGLTRVRNKLVQRSKNRKVLNAWAKGKSNV